MEVYEDGSRIRTALGHKDRDRAKREADEAAARFDSVGKLQSENLRAGPLFEKYLGEVTPNKTPHKQKHDRRASRMFTDFFGRNRAVESLNRRDWDRFISGRLRGTLPGDLSASGRSSTISGSCSRYSDGRRRPVARMAGSCFR